MLVATAHHSPMGSRHAVRPITASGTGSVLTVAKAGASSSTRRNWRTTFDLTLCSGTWVRTGSRWSMVAKCANPCAPPVSATSVKEDCFV